MFPAIAQIEQLQFSTSTRSGRSTAKRTAPQWHPPSRCVKLRMRALYACELRPARGRSSLPSGSGAWGRRTFLVRRTWCVGRPRAPSPTEARTRMSPWDGKHSSSGVLPSIAASPSLAESPTTCGGLPKHRRTSCSGWCYRRPGPAGPGSRWAKTSRRLVVTSTRALRRARGRIARSRGSQGLLGKAPQAAERRSVLRQSPP